MQRAAVLIGVKKSHTLPELQAAWDGAHRMEDWAVGQGIDPTHIKVITDEGGRSVNASRIKQSIRELVDLHTIEQLIVYFSGHGINNARSEYWLLSDAIIDPNEAVNVTGSEDLARYCGIPHVVFVSDACRTTASGLQAQGTTGSIVFPSLSNPGVEKAVDLFFGTALGHPALEIQDVNDSSKGYGAVYTDTLLEALLGEHAQVAESDAGLGFDVVRPWPLKDFLMAEVPRRVFRATQKNQQPDARITSRPDVWLSKVRSAPAAYESMPMPSSPPPPSLSESALQNASGDSPTDLPEFLSEAVVAGNEGDRVFERTVNATATLFGPTHFETECGFKISGAKVAHVHGAVRHDLLENGSLVRIHLNSEPAQNVLLVFENGTGVVLPAIPQFLGALMFVDDDLVNVNYDPSDNSWRWGEFLSRRAELQHLRAVVAASSSMGSFRLESDEDAERIARKMQIAKGFDPTLAIYAAYAYRDLGRRDRITSMSNYQNQDLGMVLFDIAMMARRLDGRPLDAISGVLPFTPLLSQGWALLPAHDITYPRSLDKIRSHVITTSLWSLYDDRGVNMLHDAMKDMEADK